MRREIPYDERLAETLYTMREEGVSYKLLRLSYGVGLHVARSLIEEYKIRHGLIETPQNETPQNKKRPVGRPKKQAVEPPPEKKDRRGLEDPERAWRMYERYTSGATLKDIARIYGCTRERVRQVITKHEREHNLPRAINKSREVRRTKKSAEEQRIKEERMDKRRTTRARTSKHFVPTVQLDIDLVGPFLAALEDHVLFYRWYAVYRMKRDGTPYASAQRPSCIEFRDRWGKVWKLHTWVLSQYGDVFSKGDIVLHRDGDITNNLRENLEHLSRHNLGKRLAVENRLAEYGAHSAKAQRLLTAEQAREAMEEYKQTGKVAPIARRLGVDYTVIWSITHGWSYRDVFEEQERKYIR